MFRRRRFFAGKPIGRSRGTDGRTALPDIAWFTPAGEEMTEQDWDSGFGKCVTVFLNGQGITEADSRGEPVTDDSFLLCLNAHYEDIEVTLPPPEYGTAWAIVVDTAVGEVLTLTTVPGVVAADPPRVAGRGVPPGARAVGRRAAADGDGAVVSEREHRQHGIPGTRTGRSEGAR